MLDADFQRTPVYERRAAASEILADLQEIGRCLAELDERILLRSFTFYGCIALVVTTFAAINGLVIWSWWQGNEELPPKLNHICNALGAACLASFALGVVAGILRETAIYRRPETRRHAAALELLRHVGRDVPAQRPVHVRLDFRPTTGDSFEKARSGSPSRMRLKYSLRWLDFSGRLHDRTKFRLTISQRVKRLRTQKRRSRDRDLLREQVSLVLSGKDPRPSLKFAPRLLNRRLRGRLKLRSVGGADGKFDATIETPVVNRDSAAPGDPTREPLFTHRELLLLFLHCHRIWRAVRRPLRS